MNSQTVLRSRPEGQGQLGFDDGQAERVAIPGTKIYWRSTGKA